MDNESERMVMDWILVVLGLVGLFVASVADLRTREVPDWLSYGLIASGVMLRLLHSSIYGVWEYAGYGLLGFVMMMGFGCLMFYARQWGGGDAKIMMGVGALYATRPFFVPSHVIPFLGLVVVNILMVGMVYGVAYGVWLAVKNKKSFVKVVKEESRKKGTVVLKVVG